MKLKLSAIVLLAILPAHARAATPTAAEAEFLEQQRDLHRVRGGIPVELDHQVSRLLAWSDELRVELRVEARWSQIAPDGATS